MDTTSIVLTSAVPNLPALNSSFHLYFSVLQCPSDYYYFFLAVLGIELRTSVLLVCSDRILCFFAGMVSDLDILPLLSAGYLGSQMLSLLLRWGLNNFSPGWSHTLIVLPPFPK
jgi:hypothetical protein